MSNFTHFDKELAKEVRRMLDGATAGLQAQGLKVRAGNIKFSPTVMTVTVEVSLLQADGTADTQESAAFKARAHQFGLDPAWLGREVYVDGQACTVAGLMPRNTRFPVQVRRSSDGALFKVTSTCISRQSGQGGKP